MSKPTRYYRKFDISIGDSKGFSDTDGTYSQRNLKLPNNKPTDSAFKYIVLDLEAIELLRSYDKWKDGDTAVKLLKKIHKLYVSQKNNENQ